MRATHYIDYFIFYFAFLPILHFGYHDGIFLRYAGINFENLKKSSFSKHFFLFVLIQLILMILVIILNILIFNSFIIYAIALTLFLNNLNGSFAKIYAVTKRFKSLSLINLLLKIITVIVVVSMLLFSLQDYKIIILSIIFSMLLVLLINIFVFRKILFNISYNEKKITKKVFLEFIEIIKPGFILVLLFFSTTFLFSIDRIFIEWNESLTTYAIYSFAHSLLSIFIQILTSVKVVVFPYVVSFSESLKEKTYITITYILNNMFLFINIIVIFIPIFISTLVPKYYDSMKYFFVLFPIVLYKAQFFLKIYAFININKTFLNALKQTIFLILTTILSSLIVLFLKLNVIYYSITILVNISLWSVIFELRNRKLYNIKVSQVISYYLVTNFFYIF